MVYVTGDTHGEASRFSYDSYLKCGDTLLVCGDFGYLYQNGQDENTFLDFLEQKPYNIAFVDGNHENFPAIYAYPVEMWNGGLVHKIRQNIFHLQRGEIFSLEGHTYFTMGGAFSFDRDLKRKQLSWWSEEMPSEEEYKNAHNHLEAHNLQVDYIITHTAPETTMRMFKPFHEEEQRLNFFLDWVLNHVKYTHWYMGHLHRDQDLWAEQTICWFASRNTLTNQIVYIDEN